MEGKLAVGEDSSTLGSSFMFNGLFNNKKPLVGMIHLPSLPGYPKHPGMKSLIQKALSDLSTLEEAGFDGALVENDNDQPHQIGVSPVVKKAFTEVMQAVLKKARIPVGMEIIYDMMATIEVAHKTDSPFVRLDVFVDDVETRWGKIYAQAKDILKLKRKIGADSLVLLTDIQVKHATMLEKKTLTESAKEAIINGSDCLLVTGTWTGKSPNSEDCQEVHNAAGMFPVFVGSGFSIENARDLLRYTDGVIVGTSIKTGDRVDLVKAKELVSLVRKIRKEQYLT